MKHSIFILPLFILLFSHPCFAVDQEVKTSSSKVVHIEKGMIDSQVPDINPINLNSQSEEFQNASKSFMTLNKQQIATFRKTINDYSKATSYRPNLVKRELKEPFDKITHISCVTGYVTSLNFVDSMGNPWTIDYILGSNNGIISAGKIDKYTIMMVSSKLSGEINLIVKLKGIDLALNLYVNASDSILDAKRIIQMNGQSPDYKPDLTSISISRIPAIKSDAFVMEQFLKNTPPEGSVIRAVNRDKIQAWSFKEKMYIRTPFILASPMAMADQGTVKDGDVFVYRLSHDVSRLNMLIDGQYFSVMVNI